MRRDEFGSRRRWRTLVELAKIYDKDELGAAFVDGRFLLALPAPGDLFAPGSLKRSVHECEEDIHEYLLFERYGQVPWLGRDYALSTLPSVATFISLRHLPASNP